MEVLIASIFFTALFGVMGLELFGQQKAVPKEQTVENLSKGEMIVGWQGSGKSFFGMIKATKLLKRGFRFAWVSTQGVSNLKLIHRIDFEHKNDVVLFAPHKPRNRGTNFLKLYSRKLNERALDEIQRLSQNVVLLTSSFYKEMPIQQCDLVELVSEIILIFSLKYKKPIQVTLWDVYQFFKNERFREMVFNVLDDQEKREEFEAYQDATVDSVERKLRGILKYRIVRNALCYTKDDAIDMFEMFNKIFIVDLPKDPKNGCGILCAKFIAKAVMIMFNIQASRRDINSPFYEIFCDEFYDYAHGIEDVFTQFPDLHRQRRVTLCVIFQKFKLQLNEKLYVCAMSMVNRYFMTLQPHDDTTLCQDEAYKKYKGQFASLPQREYIAFFDVDAKMIEERGKTEDLDAHPSDNTYNYVINNNISPHVKGFEWWYLAEQGYTPDDEDDGEGLIEDEIEGD